MSESTTNESIVVQCLTDGDCSKGQGGVFKVCYLESQPEDNFCDCSIIHGWQGEKCDEESLFLAYTRFMTAAFIVVALGFIFSSAWLLNTHLTRPKKKKKHNYTDSQTYKPMAILLTSILVGSTLLLISHSFILPSVFNPTQFELKDNNVVDKFRKERELILVGSGMFLVIASLQIIATWYGTIHNLGLFFPERTSFNSDKRKFLTIVLVLCIAITFFVLIGLGEVKALSIMSVVTGVVGCVFYTFGYFSLKNYISEVCWEENGKYLRFVTFIYKVNVCALFGIVLFATLGVVGQLMFQDFYRVGEFNFFVFFFDMAQVCWYIFLGNCIFYCFRHLYKKQKVSAQVKV